LNARTLVERRWKRLRSSTRNHRVIGTRGRLLDCFDSDARKRARFRSSDDLGPRKHRRFDRRDGSRIGGRLRPAAVHLEPMRKR
jgi:hypothetical protein